MDKLRQNFQSLPVEKRQAIIKFSSVLIEAGYECFLVGGCCRDLLLGLEPNDFDFATNCPLSVTKKLFSKVIATGEPHGTLTVIFTGYQFELTRYRKDISTDGRRAVIRFADTVEEDQERRDLRLNSLAYDVVADQIVDSQNGLKDFEDKTIRFVGKAQDRILEDHLRALRYGRMILALKPLGFDYQQSEMKQVIQVFDINILSIERLFDELLKMLALQPREDRFLSCFLFDLRILQRFDLNDERSKYAIKEILASNSLLPLWYVHFKTHSLSETAKSMRLSRENKRLIEVMAEFESQDLSSNFAVKKLLFHTDGLDREKLQMAVKCLFKKDIETIVQGIVKNRHPVYIKDLAVDGNDMKTLGIEGEKIGLTLKYLLERVWKQPQINQVGTLMDMAAEHQRGAVNRRA